MEETKTTWQQVMDLKEAGASEARGIANMLDDDDIETICATIDFFGGNWKQAIFDLSAKSPLPARYRVFDFLAMCVQGRLGEGVHNEEATKVLVHSFIKSGGVPSKFVEDLRVTDYDIDHSYKSIELTY